jgi:hypothetical protein
MPSGGVHPITSNLHNPKLDEGPILDTRKDPVNWVSGDDPITGHKLHI